MARDDADKAAARAKRKQEKKALGTAFSISCAGATYYEKLFIQLHQEKHKLSEMDKEDPKRKTQRGIIRGIAQSIKTWQEFHGTPEDMTLKEIENRTPWDLVPSGYSAKLPNPWDIG